MKSVFRTLALVSLLGIAGNAFAADKVCKLEISGTDSMTYDKKELAVAGDCTQVELTLHHTGKLPAQAMGHNWVLSKTSDMSGVVNDGMGASFADNHIKKGDARVIAHTKIVGGGQSDTITFPTSTLTKGGAYSFFCTFPGHSSMMKGTLKFG
jgi:azurin